MQNNNIFVGLFSVIMSLKLSIMRKNQLTLYFLFCTVLLTAQTDLKLGQWKSYLPYHIGRSITQSESTVYYASLWSIFMIDKEENSVRFMSKVEGLSDVGMGEIKYVPGLETLIACYRNSNIDLIKPDKIINLPFIEEDQNIVGDKQIYNIFLGDNNLAYLSCGFGVVELNVEREEFGFTTKMNLKVNDITIYEGFIFAATDEGIYRAPYDGQVNLQDFGNWDLLGSSNGFPDDYSTVTMEVYNGKLYLNINDALYSYSSNTLTEVYTETDFTPVFLTAEGSHMIYGLRCEFESCDRGKVLFFDENLNFVTSGNNCVNRTNYAIEDEQGRIWYSDRWDDIRIAESADADCVKENFNSPYTHEALNITINENDVYVATESPPANTPNGYYVLKDGFWTIYNGLFNGALRDIKAAITIAVHPVNKKVYIGSFNQGLWEQDGDNFTLYDDTNSLLGQSEEVGRVRVGGLAFDANNNLWITNHTSPTPLLVMREDGEWQNNFEISSKTLIDLVIDDVGNKWCLVGGEAQGLVIFNEGDLDDPTDDQVRILTTSNSSLPSNRVLSLEVDLDGDVWIGTDQGVVVFECGSNAFDPQCQGSKRIVEVDGFNAFLLETETVNTIAVDGANRKWFGTTNGVFVQSPNGQEQVAFFDTENSPLFSNQIDDIAVNQNTGEVFIGTGSGLISVRGEATGGSLRHSNEVYAFPNPVRPDYDGPIAIKGLPRDANVKIVDIAGQLIFETTALGGQAIWDGRDYDGRKAASGVYLVFSTSKEILNDPDAAVTKILFIK